ncbi:MAG: radical SAM protein [Spirochaetaceae bacterium]|jgi:radical SAM superfamily enzyme YgiQ (UPF0313 family)|nr:radical SAM protein [Spirochaetaceae bacterium]
MHYYGDVYRPPSEAYSLIIQVTLGCSSNTCTFCSMYRNKPFRIRGEAEIFRDLEECRAAIPRVDRIFLADGDALVLKTESLVRILDRIAALFPECERVGIYATPKDVIRKSPEDLELLREKGVRIAYIGAESGSDTVLRDVQKGATRAEIIEAIRKTEDAGIATSATFIVGLAGPEGSEDHARASGSLISEAEPSYAALLTLHSEPPAPLYYDIQSGKFRRLTVAQSLAETRLILENINVTKDCVFRTNHASNYLALGGTLPQDKPRLLRQLLRAETEGFAPRPYHRGL